MIQCVASALDAAGIAWAPGAVAGLFFWLDLRAHLDSALRFLERTSPGVLATSAPPSRDAAETREAALHRYLEREAGVKLLRGQIMHASEPGFFRLCFTAEPTDRVLLAVQQMGEALARLG